MEPEPLLYTDILKYRLSAFGDGEAEQLIQQFEAGLASGAEWWSNRIEFLTDSGHNVWNITLDCHEQGSYKIPVAKMRKIVHIGLVAAWQKNIVTAAEIGAFADDVASLQEFSAVLGETDNRRLSPIWEHAHDIPPGFTPVFVNIGEIYRKEQGEPGEKKK